MTELREALQQKLEGFGTTSMSSSCCHSPSMPVLKGNALVLVSCSSHLWLLQEDHHPRHRHLPLMSSMVLPHCHSDETGICTSVFLQNGTLSLQHRICCDTVHRQVGRMLHSGPQCYLWRECCSGTTTGFAFFRPSERTSPTTATMYMLVR
jgi:hypothetical protein